MCAKETFLFLLRTRINKLKNRYEDRAVEILKNQLKSANECATERIEILGEKFVFLIKLEFLCSYVYAFITRPKINKFF